MGNTVVWKPAATRVLAAHFVMQLLEAAGLPPGVINFVPGRRGEVAARVLADRDFAGHPLHRLDRGVPVALEARRREHRALRALPAHRRRDRRQGLHRRAPVAPIRRRWRSRWCAARSSTRGRSASAASRVYIPRASGRRCATALVEMIASIKLGDVARLPELHGRGDRRARVRQASRGYLDEREAGRAGVAIAGRRRRATTASGWFIRADADRSARTRRTSCMCEELFGPVLTALRLSGRRSGRRRSTWCDRDVALRADRRGVRRSDRAAIARGRRRRCATPPGNFYINDKPTGAVVGQQPFGGARASRHQRQGRLDAQPAALGRRRGRSRRPSCRRPTTAIRS